MKFRNNKNRLYTKSLFKETSEEPEQILYTLTREDGEYPSLYKLYMAEEDLYEFNFAVKYFESFRHWKSICQSAWMTVHIAEWREELELKIKAKSLKSLIDKADKDPSVAKYLLQNKWVEKAQENNPVTNLRGRPSKEEVRSHLKLIVNEEKRINEDYERIKNL